MADITESKKVIKGSVMLYLKTPLLLKSGYGDVFSDSTIEKTFDGEKIHINGYNWAGLMRRCIDRIKGGSPVAEKIGKYNKDREGVSPLWCESSFIPISPMYIRAGNAIDRKYGAAKEGALFNDEIAPAGLTMRLNWNYFLTDEDEKEIEELLLGALWVLNSGIENIGGGWSYGMGRLGVKEVCLKTIDLKKPEDKTSLWRFDDETIKKMDVFKPQDLKKPQIEKPWSVITASASITKGQLLAIHSSYPVFDEKESFYEYPDAFVYRGYIIKDNDDIKPEFIIPGRSIRQALLSVPIERKIRTKGRDIICDSLAGLCTCDECKKHRSKKKSEDSPECKCVKCNWFGSGAKGGIIAVTDAVVEDGTTEIIHRINLCEHSMQNINLFSEEYLTHGTFRLNIIIDESRNKCEPHRLKEEVLWVLNDMAENSASPPGWYRIGASSTATGQVSIKGTPEIELCGGIDG